MQLKPDQQREDGTIRLYFTEEKICIGSYSEVEKYETETGKSYFGSDFFRLPNLEGYTPIGKTPEEIWADKSEAFRQKLKARAANKG